MKQTIRILALSSLTVIGVSAHAQDGISAGITAGTVGAGVQVSFAARPDLNIRAQYTKWYLTDTKTIDNIDYDVDLTIGAVGLYADYYPFSSNGFHLTAGLTRSLTELEAKNRAIDVTINGTKYTSLGAGNLRARAEFGTAPYLGIGWGRSIPTGWGVKFNVGAHFLGKPDVTLTDRTGSVNVNDLRAEEKRAENDIGEVIYPEVSLTVSYGW